LPYLSIIILNLNHSIETNGQVVFRLVVNAYHKHTKTSRKIIIIG
jgi:hypothetical protein